MWKLRTKSEKAFRVVRWHFVSINFSSHSACEIIRAWEGGNFTDRLTLLAEGIWGVRFSISLPFPKNHQRELKHVVSSVMANLKKIPLLFIIQWQITLNWYLDIFRITEFEDSVQIFTANVVYLKIHRLRPWKWPVHYRGPTSDVME